MTTLRFAPRTRAIAILFACATSVYLFYMGVISPDWHVGELQFNAFALISSATLLINLALFIYFVRKPAHTDDRFWLGLYLMSMIVYSGTELMQRLSVNPYGALFWGGASSIAVVVGPSLFLFALAYTNQSERKYNGTVTLVLLSGLVVLFFETFTNIVFINSIKYAAPAPWGFDLRGAIGPASGLLVIWYYGLLIAALARLISFRRHTRNIILRRQSLLFIFAISIPLVGGSITDVILPTLGIYSVPPLAAALGTPAAILFVYGIIRYQLLTVSPTQFSGTILGIMQEAVVVTDGAFNVMYVNPEAEKLLNISATNPDKSGLIRKLTASSQTAFQEAFKNQDARATTIDIDHLDVQHTNGSTVPVRLRSSLLLLDKFQTFVIVLTDITKELQTRSVIEHEVTVRTEELHQAQAYLVSSINSLEQGFVLVNHQGGVELINGVAARLFGVSAADRNANVNLADALKTMSWDWDINLPEVVTKVLQTKHHKQKAVSATNGSSFEIFVTPVISGTKVLGATVIIQDVTEQRILDRSKDEFFSIASHELRTPLTAIRGNMSMVKDYFPEAMKDDGLKAMVNDTHDASIRLISIVNDFLDSSKLEQGKMEFNLQPVALGPIVDSVKKDLDVLLDKQKDKLVTVDLQKLPKVVADEGRIRQIIYNLLSNAMKYTTDATITISGVVTGDKLDLKVADTGKGISPENQKILFHKFQQAGDPLTRDDTKGTGLGLYISRLLATNMHGDVTLERSEVGKGSTFVVTLPVAK